MLHVALKHILLQKKSYTLVIGGAFLFNENISNSLPLVVIGNLTHVLHKIDKNENTKNPKDDIKFAHTNMQIYVGITVHKYDALKRRTNTYA